MQQKAKLSSTVVVKLGDGWAVERRIGHYAIVFADQYLSASQARKAAEALFPDHQVIVEKTLA
ncbi:MAG: hypothetical protein ACN6OP_29340 [Pseudomonadales bacterium]